MGKTQSRETMIPMGVDIRGRVNDECNVNLPCLDNLVCNVDTNRCAPIQEGSELLETVIKGNKFVGSQQVIHRVLKREYEQDIEDLKCMAGQDVIMLEEYKGQRVFETNILAFILTETGQPTDYTHGRQGIPSTVFCIDKTQLLNTTRAQNFIGNIGPVLSPNEAFEYIYLKPIERFYRIDMSGVQFFVTQETINKIQTSRQKVFLLYPTKYIYYSRNPHGVSSYENIEILYVQRTITIHQTDYVYDILPIGPIGSTVSSDELYSNINDWLLQFGIDVQDISTLQELNLTTREITTIPNSINQLVGLKVLNISFNQLVTLPETIGELTQLEFLILNDNNLISLPESIGNLNLLHVLLVHNNQLTSLPSTINNVGSRSEHSLLLNLRNNRLTTLPNTFYNFPHLGELDITNNPLSSDTINNLYNIERMRPTFSLSIGHHEGEYYEYDDSDEEVKREDRMERRLLRDVEEYKVAQHASENVMLDHLIRLVNIWYRDQVPDTPLDSDNFREWLREYNYDYYTMFEDIGEIMFNRLWTNAVNMMD